MCFLMALASAERVGELLKSVIQGQVFQRLGSLYSFLSAQFCDQNPVLQDTHFKKLIIPSLKDLMDRDGEMLRSSEAIPVQG